MHVRFLIAGLLLSFIGLTAILVLQKVPQNYTDQVAVLMYHHVHDTDQSSSTITTKLFREQLSFLRGKGYHFISLQQFRQFLNGAAVPDNAVLVTFDDGYQSFYENARPILQEFQVPAVNFIITGSLDHPLDDIPPKMSRAQIRSMTSASGLIDVQCHTHAFHGKRDNGKALILQEAGETDAQYKARIGNDIHTCESNLKELYPGPLDALAYPYGIYNKQAAAAVQTAGIRYAFTIEQHMATRGVNPMRIPRINAGSPYISPERLQATIMRRVVALHSQ